LIMSKWVKNIIQLKFFYLIVFIIIITIFRIVFLQVTGN